MGYNSPETVHLITEVSRRVYADRAEFLGDPRFLRCPAGGSCSHRRTIASGCGRLIPSTGHAQRRGEPWQSRACQRVLEYDALFGGPITTGMRFSLTTTAEQRITGSFVSHHRWRVPDEQRNGRLSPYKPGSTEPVRGCLGVRPTPWNPASAMELSSMGAPTIVTRGRSAGEVVLAGNAGEGTNHHDHRIAGLF